MVLFRAAHRCPLALLPKSGRVYTTTMKVGTGIPYLTKVLKINKLRDTHQDFFIGNFCYIKKYRYRLHFNT